MGIATTLRRAATIEVPRDLAARERWYYSAAVVGCPASIVGHVAFALVFWYWGIWQMALYNVGAVVLWAVTPVLLRQRKFGLHFFVLAAELACHAILATLFLGWLAGAQYYLILVPITAVLAPSRIQTTALYSFLAACSFVGLYWWLTNHTPWAHIDGRQLAFAQTFCALHVFATAAIIVLYVKGIATRAETELEAANERSENLLKNVLPQAIAERLKEAPTRIAESFDAASVLFADVIGFTEICSSTPAANVVDLLDQLFSAFDLLVARFGLEKIKTIGDCYMVAAGVPAARADHADAIADLALAMLEILAARNEATGASLRLRIGIHSGPVIAGVIGKSRFLYDLWGDTVNIAARMESHGEAGKIQVSDATDRLLSDRFSRVERGIVSVKGKGEMNTYWLLGRVPSTIQETELV
jgi:class 3 adenylate cyclase